MNVWETVQKKLEENGIKTYPPATASGECKSEYVVLKQSGSSQAYNFSSEIVYYDFLLYVPKNKYQTLDDFERKVKHVLDTQLYPMLMPTGANTPDYYDDEIKAHMRSFNYRLTRRNKHL